MAALWFVPASLVALEWTDEGHLIYLASRVAEGAVPYRDFHHNYGPGTFLLNGWLFRLFGQDLLVVRLSLIVVKATLALAVAWLAGRAGGARARLLAWGIVVAIWGAPLWIFSTPYASIYQATLSLVALVALLALRERHRLRGLAAGLCIGAAVTFKQTAGGLAGIGVLAFLLHERCGPADDARGVRDPAAVAIRLALLAGSFVLVAVYLGSFAGSSTWFVLGTPLAAILTWLTLRVLRDRSRDRSDLVVMGWTALGAAVAPAGCIAYFASQGALRALVGDVWGLAGTITWLVPLPAPDRTAASAASIVGLGLGAVELVRRAVAERGTRRVAFAAASAAAVAALVAVGSGARFWEAWPGWVFALITWLPVAATWLATGWLLCVPRTPAELAAPTLLAAALLLALQPVGDITHVLLALPVFVVPLAALAARWVGPRLPARGLAVAAVGVLVIALIAPFVQLLARSVGLLRAPAAGYRRATAIHDLGGPPRDARALVDYLARTPEETRIVVLPSMQMVEFLAGRRSALEREEFGLYLGTYGLVSEATARRLVDQKAAIAELGAHPVLVVRVHDPQATAALNRVFPTLLAYLDSRFHEVASFGPYQVLAPATAAAD